MDCTAAKNNIKPVCYLPNEKKALLKINREDFKTSRKESTSTLDNAEEMCEQASASEYREVPVENESRKGGCINTSQAVLRC